MNGSILTNQGAMVALQTMKSINKDLSGVQDMISTGKKVATSKDNAAIWAISSIMESDVSAFKAVSDSLALGESTVAVARNASEQVKDALIEIKDKIIAAQEENVDRSKIQADVDAIRSQIKSIVGASQFNGLNLLKGSEDLEVLSSLDRASNGAVTTSSIAVEAKSLDSGTAATSTAGSDVVQAVNVDGPVITATLGLDAGASGEIVDGVATTTEFTNGTAEIDFVTNATGALDEGDEVVLRFSDGTNAFDVTYTQTATGATQTTAEELAAGIAAAYTAFAARDAEGAKISVGQATDGTFDADNITDGDYDSANSTYHSDKGTYVFADVGGLGSADALSTLAISESAGTLTIDNLRDEAAITITGQSLTDYTETTLNVAQQDQSVTDGTISLNYTTVNVDGTGGGAAGDGIQADDILTVNLGTDTNGDNGVFEAGPNSYVSISITGAALSETQLAETVELATRAYVEEDISSGTAYDDVAGVDRASITANGNGSVIINGATVTFNFNIGTDPGPDEATLQTALNADVTVTNGGAGIVDITSANGNPYALQSDLAITSASGAADIAIDDLASLTTGGGPTDLGTTVAAGTIGDFVEIDINNAATQDGDTLSITIEGVNLDAENVAQPITYTTDDTNTPDQSAAGFATAINTALIASGVTDFAATASSDGSGVVSLKNYNTTTTRDVSELSVVNELTTAAVATDADGAVASTIAAGATNNITFAANTVTEGDTYEITVGASTVNYTARAGDNINDIGRNLEGLLKLDTADDITVDFTAVTDPTTTDSVLTVTNNGTSSITSFSTTVKSGGTAGGGLELLDDIDVTTASKAEGSLDLIEGLIEIAVDAASSYGSSEKRLESQQDFISKLTDSLKLGIGSLVDANLEETSARLQALQVQQQLGTQALSIANQAPQNILALFR